MIAAFAAARVNLGCGKFPLDGYLNIDAHEEADLCADVWELVFHDLDEVRMDHLLEHFGWRETVPLLERVRSWLQPGGLFTVEVPDMERIMAGGVEGDWLRYVYGSQQHDGEFHRTGFKIATLRGSLLNAGFKDVQVQAFSSSFQTRRGMPCLKGTATA